ncbi:hypothetical protein BDF19DRAFT_445372, partial [Syncephalis fuscata]
MKLVFLTVALTVFAATVGATKKDALHIAANDVAGTCAKSFSYLSYSVKVTDGSLEGAYFMTEKDYQQLKKRLDNSTDSRDALHYDGDNSCTSGSDKDRKGIKTCEIGKITPSKIAKNDENYCIVLSNLNSRNVATVDFEYNFLNADKKAIEANSGNKQSSTVIIYYTLLMTSTLATFYPWR